jgi:hypothetical protein
MNKSIFSNDPIIKEKIKKIDDMICSACGAKGWEFSLYNLEPAYGKYCSGWCLFKSLKNDDNSKKLVNNKLSSDR